jgi:hypothetical protein
MKHSENNSEDDFKIKLKKNSWNNLKIIFFEINFNSIIKLWSIYRLLYKIIKIILMWM